ncbi:hypothetical protein D3C81_2248590 [compost metagenome]
MGFDYCFVRRGSGRSGISDTAGGTGDLSGLFRIRLVLLLRSVRRVVLDYPDSDRCGAVCR